MKPGLSPRHRASRWTGWGLVALGALAVAAVYVFDPATHTLFPPCPLRAGTGWECPTCGGLRATHLLLHGRIRDAYALNPYLFYVLPALLLLLIPRLRRNRRMPFIILGVLLILFLRRNFF